MLIPTPVTAETSLDKRVAAVARGSMRDQSAEGIRASAVITNSLFFPLLGLGFVSPAGCWIPGENYGTVAVISAPTSPPASVHPDLNFVLRGYISTTAYLGLVDYGGPSDASSPQLYDLFADHRTANLSAAYRVYDWDWGCNCPGAPLADYAVTLAGMIVTPTETIHVPGSGYDIGLAPTGYEVMVLYASESSITLKYTREDNVVTGYTVHADNVCVEPRLLNLYESWNAAGRSRLPALYAGQAFGRAAGSELRVAIRDSGSFLDPRSRSDWWQGR